MKRTIALLVCLIASASFLPSPVSESALGASLMPMKQGEQFSIFPEPGVYVIPTKNGGFQRALFSGPAAGDVLSVGCLPATIGSGGYATRLCPIADSEKLEGQ
ncbi:MAG: hypothetical protein Q4P05_01175 [Actinomycetaceae bacterium]|nr:hypothetical protein [Actinomycetaceae bacterium]